MTRPWDAARIADVRLLCANDAGRSRKRSESSADAAFANLPEALDEIERLQLENARLSREVQTAHHLLIDRGIL